LGIGSKVGRLATRAGVKSGDVGVVNTQSAKRGRQEWEIAGCEGLAMSGGLLVRLVQISDRILYSVREGG
jgi:hypothetical protein